MKHAKIHTTERPARAEHRVAPGPRIGRLLAIGAALPLAIAACAGRPITTPISGEPICPDYEVGAAKAKWTGGLRFPVQLVVKNGSNVVAKTIVLGRRTEQDPAARVLLSDDDETYTVEWGQCENERAGKVIDAQGRDTKGTAVYECGKAEVYKTEQLTTKKGDPASHALTFPAPPNAACRQSTAPTPAAADAGAPDAGNDADAGTPPSEDAGADAEAASSDAGSTGPASDAGSSDAGASTSK